MFFEIVLADGHNLFRQGLKRIIEEVPDLKVVGEAENGIDLLRLVKELMPDMIIVDMFMPDLGGTEVLLEIQKARPGIKSLFLGCRHEYLRQGVTGSAHGYLLKQDADTELITAIKKIREGRKYVSGLLSQYLAEIVVKPRDSSGDCLSPRERQILKFIAQGKLNREIADLFSISVRTVEHHRSNIMKKLKVGRPADLIKYAIKKGYM